MGNTSQQVRYVSLAEASVITSLSPRTLRRAIKQGSLRAHRLRRLIRIELLELERWIKSNGTGQPAATLRADRRPSEERPVPRAR